MGKYAYGITKLEVGDIATADGTIENAEDLTGVIYKDTITMDEPEATETNHYVEDSRYPVVSISEAGLMKVQASLFGASPDQKISLMGGTKTTVDEVDTWNSPRENVVVEKYLKVTLKSGHEVQYPRVKVNARHTGDFSEKGVLLTPVSFTVLNPQFETLFPIMIKDPA